MDQPPRDKKIVKDALFGLKRAFHQQPNMESAIKELEWFLGHRKSGTQSQDNPDLWEKTTRMYGEFTDEELEELLDQLKAD